MRLPLLVGARPKVVKTGPVVNLSSGNWMVVVNRLYDTVLRIYYHSPTASFESIISTGKNGLVFSGPCKLRAEIAEAGTERDIDAFVEQVA